MANHRSAQAGVNRTHLKDANEIDGKITKDIVNKLALLEKYIPTSLLEVLGPRGILKT